MMKNITLTLCLLFILAGCSNITAPQAEKQNARTLKISVSSGEAGSRTLFPSAFTKYVLSFTGAAANGHADITLGNGQTSTVVNASDLGTGELTITAKGYVMINGTEYEAAQGSATVNISSGGPLPSPIISISASMKGANGYFTYSVSFPSSIVDSASLRIRPFNGGSWDAYSLNNSNSGTIELAPGYYLMSIWLYNGYQIAGLTEIVHIYSNMETRADYTFTEDDFAKLITLSGTIDVKVGGQVPSGSVRLDAYLDENYQNYVSEGWVDKADNTWTMRLAAFDSEVPLYFKVEAHAGSSFSREIGLAALVRDQNISGIALAPLNFSAFTISGTVDFQVTGAELQRAYVIVDGENGGYLCEVNLNDGSWSWQSEPFNEYKNLSFSVQVLLNIGWFSKDIDGKSLTVKDQDAFIDLGVVQFKFITVSGTVDIQVTGEIPQSAYVQVYEGNGSNHYWNNLDSVSVNLTDGTWSWTTEPFNDNKNLSFSVQVLLNIGWFSKDIDGKSLTVKDQDAFIDLGTVQFKFITVSGTVDIKVNGEIPQEAYVRVYEGNGSGHYVSVNLTNGTWSWKTESFNENKNLSFAVIASANNSSFTKDIDGKSVTVKDQDTFIDLGTVQFNVITLSGTINVKYNGGIPYRVVIYAIDQTGSQIGSTSLYSPGPNAAWSITMEPFNTAKNVSFRVSGYDSNNGPSPFFVKYAENVPITVTNASVSGINLNLGDMPNPNTPVSPVPLVEAVWANGKINESYKVDWYSIDVASGTTYYLWFNNLGDGLTLYGEIAAWYGNGSQLFATTYNAWADPVSFTAASTGKIYIRVRGRYWYSNTGTYELIYSTASNRPVMGVENYTVTFNSNGGSPVSSRNVVSNAKLGKPADPVKDGFRFGGWYKEAALSNAWNFATDTVTGSTTLYAKWNPKEPETVVVAFEGFSDEFIDLTQSAYSISKSKNQDLRVTVEGIDSSPQWYLDGTNRGSYGSNYTNIYASNLAVGVHTLSAIITYNGKPYSKELSFRVTY